VINCGTGIEFTSANDTGNMHVKNQ